jgi:hypothetical protein
MSTDQVYQSRSVKRPRRTRGDIKEITDALIRALEVDHPMTVRQLFYRLVSNGVIDKTEAQYKNTVTRLAGELRLDGVVPFEWITDNTRLMRKPKTHSSLQNALDQTARTYRRAIFDE